MMRKTLLIGGAWSALACAGGSPAWSQPPKSAETPPAGRGETGKSAWLHDVFSRDVSEYEFYLDPERREKLSVRAEPVMRFSSPVDRHGEVYVWTGRGRPQVVGCFFSIPQVDGIRIVHEFRSLAEHPLASGQRGAYRWQPEEAGVSFAPVPDTPEPATSEARRLAQMRELARRYGASMMRQGVKWDLRLLPQPLYRYENTDKDSPILDGALFSYVWTTGTDPEVLLLIEAHRAADGVRWRFAPASLTNREAWVTDRGREVWRVPVPQAGNFDGATTKRYGALGVKTVPLPENLKASRVPE